MSDIKQYVSSFKVILLYIVLGFLVGILITNTLVKIVRVPSSSMEPTINANSKLVVSLVAYVRNTIQRGDVIVFSMGNQNYTKRVLALPGETIKCINGQIYINNNLLEESYNTLGVTSDFEEVVVPTDCYFVLGDNRENSFDSRYWHYPFVTREQIFGRIVMELTPRFKLISR